MSDENIITYDNSRIVCNLENNEDIDKLIIYLNSIKTKNSEQKPIQEPIETPIQEPIQKPIQNKTSPAQNDIELQAVGLASFLFGYLTRRR